MLRAKTGMDGKSGKTAGYADVQSPFMGSAISWQGIAFPITGQAVSMDVTKLSPNNIIHHQHSDMLITCKWLELMEKFANYLTAN